MKEQLVKLIEDLISKANELNDIFEDLNNSPMICAQASWERIGILYSLKKIFKELDLGDFDELFKDN